MPSLDEIRTLTVRAVSDGVDKVVAELNEVAAAQGNVTAVSEVSARAQTTVRNALERNQMSLDANYRANTIFNRSQLEITRGFNEGMISNFSKTARTRLLSPRSKSKTTFRFQKKLVGEE